MTTIFKKLNLKDQKEILVLQAPESFEPELAALENVGVLVTLDEGPQVAFTLAFVTKLAEIERVAEALAKKAPGDAVVWFAYPKGTSKKYRCEFNRDTGWEALGRAGFEPVAAGGDRRRLVGGALPAGGVHQDADPRCQLGDERGGKKKAGKK